MNSKACLAVVSLMILSVIFAGIPVSDDSDAAGVVYAGDYKKLLFEDKNRYKTWCYVVHEDDTRIGTPPDEYTDAHARDGFIGWRSQYGVFYPGETIWSIGFDFWASYYLDNPIHIYAEYDFTPTPEPEEPKGFELKNAGIWLLVGAAFIGVAIVAILAKRVRESSEP